MLDETLPHTERKSIWLLSPYHTGSHASWATGYQSHSRHHVELLTMSGRFWKWRMQGGAMELATQIRNRLSMGEHPDVILATDMVNLAALQGLLRRELALELRDTAFLLYMHENQLTYPWRPGEKPDLTYAMINWTSQLCADGILFNSRYHQESWFGELPKLLKHYPDYNHLALVDEVRTRSMVLPVGIDYTRIRCDNSGDNNVCIPPPPELVEGIGGLRQAQSSESERLHNKVGNNNVNVQPPLILWNQRWEYDKRPDLFFKLLYRLKEAGIGFRVAVAGENFRNVPEEFETAKARLADEIVHWGYLASYPEYVALLQESDLVISTAIHEFFGISVLEAIAAGVFPLLPNQLSYPELLPEELHPACLYEDEDRLFKLAVQRLQSPRPAPPSLQQFVTARFDWPTVAALYDDKMSEMTR